MRRVMLASSQGVAKLFAHAFTGLAVGSFRSVIPFSLSTANPHRPVFA